MTPVRTRSPLLAAALALLFVLALVACSDDDGSEGSTDDSSPSEEPAGGGEDAAEAADDWSMEIDQVCAEVADMDDTAAAIDGLGERLTQATTPEEVQAGLDQAADALEMGAMDFEDAAAALSEIEVPGDKQEDLDLLVSTFEDDTGVIAMGAAALRAGDLDGYVEVFEQAQAEVDASTIDHDALAESLGAPSCVPPEVGDDGEPVAEDPATDADMG